MSIVINMSSEDNPLDIEFESYSKFIKATQTPDILTNNFSKDDINEIDRYFDETYFDDTFVDFNKQPWWHPSLLISHTTKISYDKIILEINNYILQRYSFKPDNINFTIDKKAIYLYLIDQYDAAIFLPEEDNYFRFITSTKL